MTEKEEKALYELPGGWRLTADSLQWVLWYSGQPKEGVERKGDGYYVHGYHGTVMSALRSYLKNRSRERFNGGEGLPEALRGAIEDTEEVLRKIGALLTVTVEV